MVMNLTVPIGNVNLYFMNLTIVYLNFKIGENNYSRLTIPSNIWFGFQGLSRGTNLILNVSNIKHDEMEVSRKPLNKIKFDWDS